ncbi:hypothetical protein [Heterosigma akashiwo virus 01]|uniref:Uncharacterized protein n=1 Tax=Heterosigma akashiwo virus 01 TaxID=97195 RepID=A0A1C9C5D3_HAV01|nr:hypothetical protein D1R72_gp168 [Heterosigma akashiwo virus 01]AOM63499.1 hypothetical protein [Heterosigma akashiwo virus 01]
MISIKQINFALPIRHHFDANDFKIFEIDDNFKHLTIDYQKVYYNFPPSSMPQNTYCIECNRTGVHAPECTTQKTNRNVYLTTEGYMNENLPEDEMFIVIGDNVTSVLWNDHIKTKDEGTCKKKKRGRPKKTVKQKDKWLNTEKRFGNHIQIQYNYLKNNEEYSISIKISRKSIRFLYVPHDKNIFNHVVRRTFQKISDILDENEELDMNNLFVEGLNLQFQMVFPFDNDRFRDLYNVGDLHEDRDILGLTARTLTPMKEENVTHAKAMVLKFAHKTIHHKYSTMIYRSGNVLVSIGNCVPNDVKNRRCYVDRKFSDDDDAIFFDIREYKLTKETMRVIDTIHEFIVGYIRDHPKEQKPKKRLSKKSKKVLKTMKMFSNRLDGFQPKVCSKGNRPIPYGFYGKCQNMNSYKANNDGYPCCKRIRNLREHLSRNFSFETKILKGNIVPGGYAVYNGYEVEIEDVDRKTLTVRLNDGSIEKIRREDFDTEYFISHELRAVPYKKLLQCITSQYPLMTPTRDIFDEFSERISMFDVEELSEPFEIVTPLFEPLPQGEYDRIYVLPQNLINVGMIIEPGNDKAYIYDEYGNSVVYRLKSRKVQTMRTYVVIPGLYSPTKNIFISYKKLRTKYRDKMKPRITNTILYERDGKWFMFKHRTYVALRAINDKQFGDRQNNKIVGFATKHKISKNSWFVFERTTNGLFLPSMRCPEPIFLNDNVISKYR